MTENLKDLTKVELKNLDKIFYPKNKVTKGQVVEYYIRWLQKCFPS